MFDSQEYNEAVADLLAATIREIEARQALSAACNVETNDPLERALTQQKRQAVYAANNDRDEAAERYHHQWMRATAAVAR